MVPEGFEKLSMDDGSATSSAPVRTYATGAQAPDHVANEEGVRVVEVHHHHYRDGAVGIENPADLEVANTAPASHIAASQQREPNFFEGFWEYVNSAAGKVKEDAMVAMDASRPWSDFFAFSNWSFPLPGETANRIAQNFDYFKVNYGLIAASCAGFFVIINTVSLAIFGVISYAVGNKLKKLYDEDPTYQSNRGRVIAWSVLGFLGFMLTGIGPSMLTGTSLATLVCTLHCLGYRLESLHASPSSSPTTA
ncbi:PRA1 family protein D [Porphyridium purpureum]|uniref:PRA1 family protein n=1 Tax=Porphyridium purpureum TaxID=35688 RepID=A0A5J4YWU1_PORPP|nr:PRA1 family protein D [Porphyridium purpureum]|eukprot:POR2306..scf209_3